MKGDKGDPAPPLVLDQYKGDRGNPGPNGIRGAAGRPGLKGVLSVVSEVENNIMTSINDVEKSAQNLYF